VNRMTSSRAPARSVVLLLLAAAAGCGGGQKSGAPGAGAAASRPAEEARPVTVRVARVEAGRAPRIVRATGTFEADDLVVIGAKVAGRIAEVGPELGDRVERGAMLAKVEDVDYVFARDRRARALEESLTKLGLKVLPEGDIDFEKLPMVERARLEAVNVKSKYDRGLPLHARTPPLISDQDLADLKTAWDTAESGHRAAVLQARTDLAQARTRKIELDAAEWRVKDTVHIAPERSSVWLVGERMVAAGNYVSVGAPLYRLVDADPLRLRVRVPERKMAGIVPGKEALVRISDEDPGIPSKITRLKPEVDPRTRTHEVEIAVPNAELGLSVGAFAAAEIKVGEDSNVPMIPEKSIVTFAGIRKVFVPDGAKAGEKIVVTGRRIDGRVEVTAGLAPGDVFILDPPQSLVPGAPIAIEAGAADGVTK
jgi:RND family efflux transporter MFP subunit